MAWPLLTFTLVVGCGLLHLWWSRRYSRLEARLARALRDAAAEQETRRRREARQQSSTQTLLNRMAEGILVLDGAGRIQLVNPSFEALFGLTRDVRGQSLLEAVRSAELAALPVQLARGGKVLDHELKLPGLDDRCVQVNAATLTDEEGRSEGLVFVFHDLTRLRRLENTRQEFVANVSHELRTPLSLIKGCVETLLDGAKDDPEALGRFLRTIEKHADRLTFLIEDLLTLSQLESGRIALNLRSTQLREVVTRVVEDLQARARVKNMTLENRVPANLFAHADGERLEQVLFNLVDNAIKYGKTGGHAVIEGREAPRGGVEISVADDGPGIPAEARERVFERFYRGDKARSREQGGTGLGLAIVKHIIQCHGGEVRAESEPGQGTCFRFTLPTRGR